MSVTSEHLGREVWAVDQNGRLRPGTLHRFDGDAAVLEISYYYLTAYPADQVYPTLKEAERHAQ